MENTTQPTDHPKNLLNRDKIINYFKIFTNLLLIICFLIGGYHYIKYKQDLTEALEISEPQRLLELYNERTDKICICYDNISAIPLLPIDERIK